MIHIIWSGKGFLVFVFAFGFSLIANLIADCMTGSEAYWDAHQWPLATSLLASAATCWLVGQQFRNAKSQVLIDPKNGKQVILRQSHTLFFIPVMWWGPILAGFGLIALGIEFFRR
jgi:hypothetical protein